MTRNERVVAMFLIGLGSLTMVGDLLNWRVLKAIGLATAASPAPKVFTAQDGFETYANRFIIEWYTATGTMQVTELTPRIYAGLAGPYNRRNMYGAVVSYGPVLDANPRVRPMFRSVLERAFCRDHPVTAELGIPADASRYGPVRIRLIPRGTHEQPGFKLVHEVRCHG